MTNPTSGDMTITVGQMNGMPLDGGRIDGRLDGKLHVEDAWGKVAHLPFAADAQAIVDVPVPLRPIPAGVLLDDSMLGSVRVPVAKLDDDDVRSAVEVRGSEVARRLQPGRPFSYTWLRQPSAVRRGDPVLITFLRGSLRLTVTGRALEDAALGQPVRATNSASNREVQGMVSGPGEVTLGETTR
jgi:flagella basal body P-ring formation protein FlgA